MHRTRYVSILLGAENFEHGRAFLGEDAGCGALVFDGTLLNADHLGVEQEGFFDVVGDGEDWDAESGDVLLDAGEESVSHGAIDAAEGFVEEKESGFGDGEGSGEVDALAFATGEIARHAAG